MPEHESLYTELEQFHTFLGQLKGSESITVVNILVSNVFKYQITLNNKKVLPITIPTPYVFNLSTDL